MRDEGSARTAAQSLPPELGHPFRLIAFDWDGTAVASRSADATRAARAMDRLLAEGARLVVVSGTRLENIVAQAGFHVAPDNARRLFVCANRGSEVFGFDLRGRPVLLFRRVATPEEEQRLDAVAEAVKARLERLTGLVIEIVRDRLNRRKIDLIPEPEWRSPPKSEISALLTATEGRLRGAGLRGGLRAAFELTELLARELGLPEARVTSDVKHIEVGLTDKADAMRYVFRHIAAPLGIAPHDVLIVGDELGSIAGFEGSDHRMLAVAESSRAIVVSVGPEPGGVPPAVLHLAGGPERFAEVLEHQAALPAIMGPFAVQRDAAWAIDEPGFDVAREHEIESILAIGNGYVGSRASIAEGSAVSRPATFLAGAFEASGSAPHVPELVIAPDWGRLRFTIENEPFSVERARELHHRRVLDMRRGLLLREALERGPGGHLTRLRTIQLASLADRHLLIEGVELSPQNFSGTIRIDAILSGDVKSASGAAHWASFEPSDGAPGPALVGRTHSGLVAALAAHLRVDHDSGARSRCRGETDTIWASERCDLAVVLARSTELFRTVALFTSRDVPEPRAAAEQLRVEAASLSSAEHIGRHEAAWAERWRRADVTIDGAPKLDRALRFALYHLIAAANPDDPRCSIGARSLTGEAYRGHVFWDADIFMLPFFVHGYPEAARAMLTYRHLTLDGARRKAARLGYAGALYAWESADTGDETTPAMVVTPLGEVIRVLSGEEEHHISADVAYAVARYVDATGDAAFARGPGLEILLETARFWASRVEMGADGLAHVRRVIGPDEYHESVDDNAFTNWMARFNLRRAADAAEAYGAALGVTPDEVAGWRRVAGAMYLGQDPRTGLVEQFAGYHALCPIDLSSLGPHHSPVDIVLGRERTRSSQVVKQADVIQLVALLWDEFTPAARRDNFLHYEPRTAHGSSLSPGIHALVAARLGLAETAERYLEQTADIDLGNTMGNAAGGVHAAALGSLWQAVIFGAAGVRPAPDDPDAIVIEPNLLPGWRNLAFPFAWRGRQLAVNIEPGAIEVALEGEAPLAIRACGPSGEVSEVRAEPGRRWATRRADQRFEAWEEIS